MSKNILILYTRLSGYINSCIKKLVEEHNIHAHVFYWPSAPDAPHQTIQHDLITFHKKDHTISHKQILQTVKELQPILVLTAGWMDKDYLTVARFFKQRGVPVVGGMDTPWEGSIKQKFGCLISFAWIKRYFSHLMVPGVYQYEYALKLGFNHHQILVPYYSAGIDNFQESYRKSLKAKNKKFPKNFLFVGRFDKVKGIDLLIQAFIEINHEMPSHGWTLTLIGNGQLKASIPTAENIYVYDFIAPENLPSVIDNAGVFVLPSRKEPWGVVLHEFAGGGLPLICSDVCGAATSFLIHGYNGYLIEANSLEGLKRGLYNMMSKSNHELNDMGMRSYQLSQRITPSIWAGTLMSVINN